MLAAALHLALLSHAPLAGARDFHVEGDHFVLNGKPYVIRSGEMHYPRVPRPYWRDRFRKAKAMGLNTICTYVFWSLHETSPGHFDFKDNLDLAAYLKIAKEEGMNVILRPGPYICTEFDFGGLPSWLQKDPTMRVRSLNPHFIEATQRYFDKVAQVVKPYLASNGGPIIMTQVENEYGSYGDDHAYMSAIRDALRKAGFTGQLSTSDGPDQRSLRAGSLPDVAPSVNLGGGGESAIRELERFRPGTPKMVGEYWAGWFDHWGEKHHRTGVAGHLKDVEWFLKNGVSFNLYMFHGGTSFAFMPGANGDRNNYQPDITSYDYDSPLDESGRPTEKYFAFRKAIQDATGEKLPPIPNSPPTISTPPVRFFSGQYLLSQKKRPVSSTQPLTFEQLDQANGMVLYETFLPFSGFLPLSIDGVNDYAMVFVNDALVGTLDRRAGQRSMMLTLGANAKLGLLVESHARINFGSAIADEHTGIVGKVTIGGNEITHWAQYRYPLTSSEPLTVEPGNTLESLNIKIDPILGPIVYRGILDLAKPGDTFLDLTKWPKGYVWVNGHNLGRYWNAGPQRSLYVPGCWLRKGANQVTVLNEGLWGGGDSLKGVPVNILSETMPGTLKPFRRTGQTVNVEGIEAAATGAFTAEEHWQTAPVQATGRYVAFRVLSSQNGKPYAAAAEIEILDANGNPIPNARIAYADSEELEGENGSAANLIDHQPDTIWHTGWSEGEAPLPHVVIFDLGKSQAISALRYLPRHGEINGKIKNYTILISDTPFKGQ